MTSVVSGGGFIFSQVSVGGKWTWTVQASNVQGAGQLYQVADIRSPFGRLTDVNVPIPGDIITAIASTLDQFRQQLAPQLALSSPGTSSFSLTVTEGDPAVQVAIVPFQNIGAFGSFMDVTAVSNSPWLASDPTVVSGIGKNEQGQVALFVSPVAMLSSSSPYSGQVNLQDNRVSPTLVPLSVIVTVRPRPTITVNSTTVNLSYNLTTTTPSGAVQLTITNSGPATSQLSAQVAKVQNRSPWLAISPTTVGPLASSASTQVAFSVVPSGVPMTPGTYTETVLVTSGNATNSPIAVVVSLEVTA